MGFTAEELSGPFPRPVPHLGLEDELRQSLYRRIVSQAIDSCVNLPLSTLGTPSASLASPALSIR